MLVLERNWGQSIAHHSAAEGVVFLERLPLFVRICSPGSILMRTTALLALDFYVSGKLMAIRYSYAVSTCCRRKVS